jgi:hypothetical protein
MTVLDPLRKVYHVSCRPHRVEEHLTCWDVKAEDESQPLSSHWTRDEAAFEAARLAMTLLAEDEDPGLAQVVIHREDHATERVVVYSREPGPLHR